MLRLVVTSIYVILLLSLSGICNLAVAATSCQDQINPAVTTYRYADALVHFVFINGKTYAVSKSAATGILTEPDAYFAFSANIDRRYAMTGEDLASLKHLVAARRFGDARPVSIPDAATRDWLINQFGSFLGTNSSQQCTYIDAWKEYGLNAPFQSMSGTPLLFSSWPANVAPDVSTITAPQAVVMGSDGTWLNGIDGVRTSQIVEFDGKLDCAIDVTPPPDPAVDPTPVTEPEQICAVDLNGNGDIEDNESAACVQTEQGMLCPIGSISCDNPPNCSQGTYNTTTRMCEWTSESTYQATSNNVGGVDLSAPVCSTCTGNSCIGTTYLTTCPGSNPTGYMSSTPGIQPTIYSCNPGDTLSGTTCIHTTINQAPVTCPLGPQYACMESRGSFNCSPNQCFSPTNPPGGSVDVEMDDDDMLQDDARNPDGSCGGQLIVFNGKRSRCRPPGLKVGMINNCCEGDEVMSEDTGNNIATAVSAVKTAYQIGQVAYYSYMISTGSAAFSAGATAGTVTVTSLATSASTTLSGAVASGVSGSVSAMGAGASTAGAVTAGIQSYAAALLNPATIAVAVVVMVVMKVLMGNGCDQGDIQTSMQNESRQCHYIGSYCQTRWPLVGCVQRARGYCCFNSIMSRIIHEQGRPQLAAFGADGGWGTPEHPNCRGFTPAEFEALDFAKIDLSEYYQEIQNDLTVKIDNATERINETIQNRVNQIGQ